MEIGISEAETSKGFSSGRVRGLLAGFTAAHFAHHVSNSLINPLLPLIRDSFALSYAQSGFLVSSFSLSLGLSNAPAGVLADRFGARWVVVAGLVLTGAISVAVGLAGAYWQLMILLAVMGMIAATYHAPSAALIAQAVPPRARGAAQGFHITGGHLSFFATPLVASLFVSEGESWRAPFIWFAFAPVLAGAVIWLMAAGLPRERKEGLDRLAVFRELGTVMRTIGPLVSVSVVFQIFYAALTGFLTLYLVDARGIPASIALALFGVPQLLGLLGAPLGGFLSDRLGRRAVIVIGMVLFGPAYLSVTFTPNELIVLPLAVMGIAAAMRQTPTEVLVMDSAPAHRRATVLGSYYMLSQELGGLGAPVLGLLAGAVGIGFAFTSTTVALACLSLVVLAIGRKL